MWFDLELIRRDGIDNGPVCEMIAEMLRAEHNNISFQRSQGPFVSACWRNGLIVERDQLEERLYTPNTERHNNNSTEKIQIKSIAWFSL